MLFQMGRSMIMSNLKCILVLIVASISSAAVFAQPQNDICSSAIDLQGYLNQPAQLAGPFSNIGATGNDLDIATVTGCWLDDLTGNADGSSPQIDATVWFRLDGYDGVLMVYIQPCDTNLTFLTEDTQMVLYQGECDSLEVVACNEDINGAINNYWSGITTVIQSGNPYYLAVDGFNYSGFGSPELPLTTGEFCISLQEPVVAVREEVSEFSAAFPNPTDGKITLKAESAIREILISDLAGKKIRTQLLSGNLKYHELQMPEAPGVYVLIMRTDAGFHSHRIIRN
jgi:hypothetical protein